MVKYCLTFLLVEAHCTSEFTRMVGNWARRYRAAAKTKISIKPCVSRLRAGNGGIMKTLDLSLLAGVLWLGASSYAAIAEPTAAATPASTATTGDELQEIVVSGFRESLATAVEDKRHAASIVDTIAAEDIGKFPEQNLAESLQRITGVQIQRSAGEGQFVSIRGLDPKIRTCKWILDGHARCRRQRGLGRSISRFFPRISSVRSMYTKVRRRI